MPEHHESGRVAVESTSTAEASVDSLTSNAATPDRVAQLVEQRTFKSAPPALQAQPTAPHQRKQSVSDATIPHCPAQLRHN